jgi:hypothetical protein
VDSRCAAGTAGDQPALPGPSCRWLTDGMARLPPPPHSAAKLMMGNAHPRAPGGGSQRGRKRFSGSWIMGHAARYLGQTRVRQLKNCASIVLLCSVTGLATSGVHRAFPAT